MSHGTRRNTVVVPRRSTRGREGPMSYITRCVRVAPKRIQATHGMKIRRLKVARAPHRLMSAGLQPPAYSLERRRGTSGRQKRASHAQGMNAWGTFPHTAGERLNARGTFPHTAGERPHARRDICRSAQLSPSPARARCHRGCAASPKHISSARAHDRSETSRQKRLGHRWSVRGWDRARCSRRSVGSPARSR